MLSVLSVTDGAEDDKATVEAVGTADKLAALVEKLVERVKDWKTDRWEDSHQQIGRTSPGSSVGSHE